MKKICTKCYVEKLLSKFSKNYNYKDGLSYYCKSCISKYKKTNRVKFTNNHRIWVNNNKESVYEIQKRWVKKNPNYFREYYQKNKPVKQVL